MSDVEAQPSRHAAPTAPPSRRHRGVWVAYGAAAAVTAALAVGLVVTSGSGGTSTFTARGSVAVQGATIRGTTCDTADSTNFSDVDEGVAVRITDPNGKGVGTAALGQGRYDPTRELCVFSWAAKIPASLTNYSVTISHRGTLVYSKTDLTAGVQSTLTSDQVP